jgi:hypothetical protein
MATQAQRLSLFLNALSDKPVLADLPAGLQETAAAMFAAWDAIDAGLRDGARQAAAAAAFPGNTPPVPLDANVLASLPDATRSFASEKPAPSAAVKFPTGKAVLNAH